MRPRVAIPAIAGRGAVSVALVAALVGCGDARSAPAGHLGLDATTPSPPARCASTVVATLGRVARRIYQQGVRSERTKVALRLIARSVPLREAIRAGDPAAARAAAQALIATHHLTNLRLVRDGRILADVGAPQAVTPLQGTIV